MSTQKQLKQKYISSREIMNHLRNTGELPPFNIKKEHHGRKAKSYLDYPEFPTLFRNWKLRNLTKIKFAQKLGVSRPTLDKLIKEYITALAYTKHRLF